MDFKLKKLLERAQGMSPKTAAILHVVKTNSKGEVVSDEEITGVSITNGVLRNSIRAEEIAIARAIAKGYTTEDMQSLHIMISTSSLSDFKYMKRAIIIEHMKDNKEITLMTRYGKVGHLTVHELKSDILGKIE